ncbi:MAG: FecR domain-containing protein [Opitutaceae bacterium]|nr:FecR domain-containing protein [Opitutaceae bacterium]
MLVAGANSVKVTKGGHEITWTASLGAVKLHGGDIVRTGHEARATVDVLIPAGTLQLGPLTTLALRKNSNGSSSPAVDLSAGAIFLFSRAKSRELEVLTPTAVAALRGTEFVIRVTAGGETEVSMVDGEVELSNSAGSVLLLSGESGVAEHGKPPRKTAKIDAVSAIQWTLYYPSVVDPAEFGLTALEAQALANSLDAYRAGDLVGALETYPTLHQASSPAGHLFHAAVLLAAGQVDAAQSALAEVPANASGRRAIEQMLAAVWHRPSTRQDKPQTGSEWLAESYFLQSTRKLEAALEAARVATEKSRDFGAAWTRLAELNFSFGHTAQARTALTRALTLSPRHAEAQALRGFLLSAENRIPEARDAFEEAIRFDGALGDAWLGRGLARFRAGDVESGRQDLRIAVVLESNRSLFRSYLGKAYSQLNEDNLARRELDRARDLDPADPTPWLYSAIQHQQAYRYDDAIADLHESLARTDNRRLYRSQFLLDQDRAVRSSNLASIYQNAGLADVAVREATRAVEADYTNASAHLFLANSFDALRDPARINLRHETAWFNELLLASLLAPVGGGPLSQYVSQQEYSKLLQTDGWQAHSLTEWRGSGDIDQQLSLSANRGRWGGGLDFAYHHDTGSRPDNGVTRRELFGQLKFQPGEDDTLYLLANWAQTRSGDLFENYANQPANPGLRATDRELPALALLGWNRRWAPGHHTLLVASRLGGVQDLTAPATAQLALRRDAAFLQPGFLRLDAAGALGYAAADLRAAGATPVARAPDGSLVFSPAFQAGIAPYLRSAPVVGVSDVRFDFATRREFSLLAAELQQLWQTGPNTLLLGARHQAGTFDTTARLDLADSSLRGFFSAPAALQRESVDFSRTGFYAYDFFRATRALTLLAGVTRDRLARPENFRNPPVSGRRTDDARTSAKVGFTFAPSPALRVRGLYAEALGGVTFDESVRLEPVQLAGFNQAFRTVISESLAGSVEAPVYRIRGLSADGSLTSRTWWHVTGNLLREEVRRTVGAFDVFSSPVFPDGFVALPASTTQRLAYREEELAAGVHQLLGREFTVGVTVRRVRSRLRTVYPQIPLALTAAADREDAATFAVVTLTGLWNAPSGWFARAEAGHHHQSLASRADGRLTPGLGGDEFWQLDARVGRRFDRGRREVSLGALNLGDRDYHLSPLSPHGPLAHRRTVFVRVRLGL